MENNMKSTYLSREPNNLRVDEICRACMSNRGEMMSIFEKGESDGTAVINEMLMSFALIEVLENDGLPSSICSDCLQNTQVAFAFKKQCESSDSELRNCLGLKQIGESSIKVKVEKNCQENERLEEAQIPYDLLEPKLEIDYRITENTTLKLFDNQLKKRVKSKKSKHTHNAKIENSENNPDFGGYVDDETSQPLFPCSECIQCFTKQRDLKRHIKTDHSKLDINSAFCDICNQAFSQAQTLARHMKIHQENQKNKLCTFCGKCFLRSDDLKRHTRIHTGERPYSCDQCPKSYKQSSELKEHIKSHSTAKHYMCTECGKSLATRNGLYVHMKVHRGEKNHQCKYCGNKYVTTGELTSHINHIHSQDKPFTCTYEGCPRAFVTKLSLKTHMHTHTGEKPFQCITCNKSLATASSLHEHKRIHTGEKPKVCSVCDRRLGNSQALKKHMRIHTGERPYQCKVCLEKFICGSTLNTHMKTKHFEKQHECPVCHKMFALATKLRQHMRLHVDNKSYICRMCGLSFSQNTKLYQHMKTHEVVKQFQSSHLELHNEGHHIQLIPVTAQLVMP